MYSSSGPGLHSHVSTITQTDSITSVMLHVHPFSFYPRTEIFYRCICFWNACFVIWLISELVVWASRMQTWILDQAIASMQSCCTSPSHHDLLFVWQKAIWNDVATKPSLLTSDFPLKKQSQHFLRRWCPK